MKLELIATATFGLEAVVKREVQRLGYTILQTEDGKVTFCGDERGIVRANLWLRAADRVLVKIAAFEARTFEELFQQTKGIAWEEIIPPDGRFDVIGTSVKSILHSVPACQSIVKKAIASRLGETYLTERLPETGAAYTVKVTLRKDHVTLTVDTSGEGLHKRGYRVRQSEAPIKETLAAALVELSFWHPDRILLDPFCGSGTIAIEAALIGRNIAPGLSRRFVSEGWTWIPQEIWKEERRHAFETIDYKRELQIFVSDIDASVLEKAKANAREAGVADDIRFACADAADLTASEPAGEASGIVITNPPYGERIGEKTSIEKVYKGMHRFFAAHPAWSLFLITTDKTVEEKVFGKKANRRRKLYNGRLETCYYQFHGEKPAQKRFAEKEAKNLKNDIDRKHRQVVE